MGITFDASTSLFHLRTRKTSYLMQIVYQDRLAHLFWGARLHQDSPEGLLRTVGRASFSPTPDSNDRSLSPDTLPQEYPTYGVGDFRHPAMELQMANGTTAADLRYVGHRIVSGKPKLAGLPAVYAESDEEAQTLEIELFDKVSGLRAILQYSVLEAYDAITRSVLLRHEGEGSVRLKRALSMSVDFHHDQFDLLQLSGSWTRERHIHKRALVPGMQGIESRRGASGHQQNPFLALLERGATEDHGDVFGFSLVYSGSFVAQAEVDQFATTRVSVGLNPFDFEWLLAPGDSFQTPEVVLVRSGDGLGGLSRIYHKLYQQRLCRGVHRDRERPILINNWEATYFDFNADTIESIAATGASLGIELFVLDDGWFGHRDNDKTSLGDWFVDSNKLPNGLDDLAQRINKLGMQFGLWFEPEMISPDSDLYRAHPDWCLHVPDRHRTLARTQLVLDYSRADVRTYIIETVSAVLASAPISYVKWDMNRNMTEIGSALLAPEHQRETAHRYMLGLYEVMEAITSAFPHILFESCSGGGGRFDPGFLYYMPQTWTSDDTDAIERLKIQWGTSIVYPASSMGAHVSAIPNHQTGRRTPLETRGNAAMAGNFGYELDLTKLTEEEQATVAKQVALYKDIRPLVQFGELFRLLSPFEGNEAAWMYVAEDRSEAAVFLFEVLTVPHAPLKRVKLKGLDPNRIYRLEDGKRYGGDMLMAAGLPIILPRGDYQSTLLRLKAE